MRNSLPRLLSSTDLDLGRTADLLDPQVHREEGDHVSDLINRLAGLLGRHQYGDDPEPLGERLMAMGRISEAVLRPMISEVASLKGWHCEFQVVERVDGVIGSLDGTVTGPTGIEAVVEIKSRYAAPGDTTFVGAPGKGDTHWRYMCQTMAYCYMTACQTVWMPVLYFPRGGPDVQLKLHVVHFEPQELVSNWNALLNMRRKDGNPRAIGSGRVGQ